MIDRRRLFIAAGAFLLGPLAAFFFDRSLTLGKFHGLVFALYTAYWRGAFLLAMGVLALLNRKEPGKLRAYAIAALLPVLALLLLWAIP